MPRPHPHRFGRGDLESDLRLYVEHYNGHRPHRALDMKPPVPPNPSPVDDSSGRVLARNVLGGLIHELSENGLHQRDRVFGTDRLLRRRSLHYDLKLRGRGRGLHRCVMCLALDSNQRTKKRSKRSVGALMVIDGPLRAPCHCSMNDPSLPDNYQVDTWI